MNNNDVRKHLKDLIKNEDEKLQIGIPSSLIELKYISEQRKMLYEDMLEEFPEQIKVTEDQLRIIVNNCADDANLNYLDVSEVEDFSRLFKCREGFNGVIDHWDFRSAKDMRRMFWGCAKFNQMVDLSNTINFEKEQFFSDMFYGCTGMNEETRNFNYDQLNRRRWELVGNPLDTDKSIGNLLDTDKSIGTPLDTDKSIGNLLDAVESGGDIYATDEFYQFVLNEYAAQLNNINKD